MPRSFRRVVVVSLVGWLVCLIGYFALLFAGHVLGDGGCEDPSGSSNYGHASWQWWPPGTACTYEGADIPGYGSVRTHTDTPSAWSAVALVVLLVWPIAPLVAIRKLRRT